MSSIKKCVFPCSHCRFDLCYVNGKECCFCLHRRRGIGLQECAKSQDEERVLQVNRSNLNCKLGFRWWCPSMLHKICSWLACVIVILPERSRARVWQFCPKTGFWTAPKPENFCRSGPTFNTTLPLRVYKKQIIQKTWAGSHHLWSQSGYLLCVM